jgi:Tfp pilus assembly protein PilF/4-amino-4-deoxy-L-arabinose transferase-like glycosyltransferase
MKSMETFAHRHPCRFYAALFLTALTVRALYLLELPNNPLFENILPAFDHYNFDQGAMAFVKGDWLARSPNNSYAPFYKYFLALLYLVLGRNFYLVYGVQFLMGAVASVMVFWITRRLFNFYSGLCAFILFASYTTGIIYEGIILREAFITFWGVLSFFALLRLRDSPSLSRLTWATLALSGFFQGRPNTLLCLPFACVFLAREVLPQMPVADRRRAWLLFAATLTLSFLPLLIQCGLIHHRFVLFDASGSDSLIAGNLVAYSGAGFDRELADKHLTKEIRDYGANIRFLLNHVMENPFQFVLLYLRKIFFFYNGYEAPSNTSTYLYREFSVTLQFLLNRFSVISALGLMGLIIAWRQRRPLFLLYGYHIALAVSVILFLNVDRYRLPAVPYLAVPAGFALATAASWVRSRRYKNAVVFAVALAVLLYSFEDIRDGKIRGVERIRELDLNNMAGAYALRQEPKQVAAYLDRALAAYPNGGTTYFNKGVYHYSQQEWETAVFYFERVTDSQLRFDNLEELLLDSRFNLATKHINAENFIGAKAALTRFLEHRPNVPEAWVNLGYCNYRLNEPDSARDAAAKALVINPQFSPAKDLLALMDTHPQNTPDTQSK